LPENPEVNHAGHPNIQFLVYRQNYNYKLILLKTHTKKQLQKKTQSD